MLASAEKPVVKQYFKSFYKRATKHNKEERIHEYVNDRIIRLFLKKVHDRLINNRSGVHIRRIGYFYVHMVPFKPSLAKRLNRYQVAFVPTHNSIFKYWSMDFCFDITIRNKVQERIKNGYRYLNMINGVTTSDNFYLGATKYALRQYRKIKMHKKIHNEI